MPDPRSGLYRNFSKGEESQLSFHECFVIVAWHRMTTPKKVGYQIWGDDRILDRESFSKTIRSLCKTTAKWSYPPHLIVIGNQWGAGSELSEILAEVSKEHDIDVFYQGRTWAFTEVNFTKEKEHRAKAIQEAVSESLAEKK